MKNSTNFTFLIKVLALSCLLIVGYSKDDMFKASEIEEEKMVPFDAEGKSVAQIQIID